MPKRLRLDLVLVERGFFPTRQQAQRAIMAGEVQLNEQTAIKASALVQPEEQIVIKTRPRYVGRGGLKLAGALSHFAISCDGKTALDIGASTGGFTDCLLQQGAKKVFAVDVGHGQLAWSIRNDPRVVTLEKVNARSLSHAQVPGPIDLCVVDVSFISLTLILPNAWQLLTANGVMLALIKPQFELERSDVARGGIVRLPELHHKAQEKIRTFSEKMGARVEGIAPSIITGADGNQEFFICLRKTSA